MLICVISGTALMGRDGFFGRLCFEKWRSENMSELTSLRNIGKEMEKKLTAVGIDSAEKLTTRLWRSENEVGGH